MERNILYAIIVSLIGTSMVKIAYGVTDFMIILVLNLVLFGASLFAFIRVDKKKRNGQNVQDALQRDVVEKLSSILGTLVSETQNQTQAILGQLGKSEEKVDGRLSTIQDTFVSETQNQTQEILGQLGRSAEIFAGKVEDIRVAGSEGFAELREETRKLTGLLQKKMSSDQESLALLTQGVKEAAENSHVKLNELIQEEKENSKQVAAVVSENTEVLSQVLIDSREALEKMLQESTTILSGSINDGVNGISDKLQAFSTYKKELENAMEEAITGISNVAAQIKVLQDALSENLTEVSEDVQGSLNKLNRNIAGLGDKNSEISQEYQQLWKDLSRNLGETAIHNQQFLVLLQDHYKALKQVAAGM